MNLTISIRGIRSRMTLAAFVIIAVLGLGAAGIWRELLLLYTQPQNIEGTDGLESALISYYLAISGVSCLHMLLRTVGASDKFSALAWISVIAAFILVTWLLYYLSSIRFVIMYSLHTCISLCAVSIVIWIIANWSHPDFQDRVDPEEASGGDPDRDLDGDTSEYKQ